MGKTLIIAEKSKLAQNIVEAIKEAEKTVFVNNKDYFESNQWIVTSVRGHMLELRDLEAYLDGYDPEEKVSWTKTESQLPFLPDPFQFKIKEDPQNDWYRKRLKLIKQLIDQPAITQVVNAGDAGQEGHLLINLTLSFCGNKKPTNRLWSSDQTPATLYAALQTMKANEDYDSLYQAGLARLYMDWLYGINLTRYVTLKAGTIFQIGRVLTPIVNEIYNRDQSILKFTPQKYYVAQSKEKTQEEVVELTTSEKHETLENAQQHAEALNKERAFVTKRESKPVVLKPPKLFSLSTAQDLAGRLYKFKPDETLQVIQKLYEQGYVTYPRTSSEYLAEGEKEEVRTIVEGPLRASCVFKDSKTIFDNSKLEDHGAIRPTGKIPPASLSLEEQKIFKMIWNRFKAVFCAVECVVDRTQMEIQVGSLETFKLSGDIYKTMGWKEFEPTSKASDKQLPNLNVNDEVIIHFVPLEKETTPPKKHTVQSLNNYLKNPFKDESKKDSEDSDDTVDYKNMLAGLSIGTEATRAGIIKKAIDYQYINLENNTYSICQKGIQLVEVNQSLDIVMSKDKTAHTGKMLTAIRKGEETLSSMIATVMEDLNTMIQKEKIIEKIRKPNQFSSSEEVLCQCHHCQQSVTHNDKVYQCKTCNLVVFKDNKYFDSMKRKLTPKIAKSLFETGKVKLTSLTGANGNKYDAFIYLEPPKDGYKSASFRRETLRTVSGSKTSKKERATP